METPNKTKQHLPEAILTEILARLPLRSISRFKSVCRTWMSALESVYFRRLFVSLHQNSSSSWSLLLCGSEEFINLHGCETWDLPKSLATYIQNSRTTRNLAYMSCSNGLVLLDGTGDDSYVGNPVLRQWVKIPSPPHPYTLAIGLVTRVDEDVVVLGFKVVRFAALTPRRDEFSTCMCLCVDSSETGIWTSKRLHCPIYFTNFAPPMALNGTLYFVQSGSDLTGQGALIAHDFYVESHLCQVIPLPDQNSSHDFKRALTASSGFVMYLKTLAQEGDNVFKIWRLINDSTWQLVWEISLPFIRFDIGYYAPVAMHPFDPNIVYLWSQQDRYLISCNLQTQKYKIFGDESQHQHCFINQSICEKHMDKVYRPYLVRVYTFPVILYQFVLPRWLESMPCPPQVEMIDTT